MLTSAPPKPQLLTGAWLGTKIRVGSLQAQRLESGLVLGRSATSLGGEVRNPLIFMAPSEDD